jgi:hypothetical protein
MAMLLYNFLLSRQVRVDVVWSPDTRRYESQRIEKPVLENFGITPITGYITAVENYAINLDVPNYVVAGGTLAPQDVTFFGNPINQRNTAAGSNAPIRANVHDVEISFGVERMNNANPPVLNLFTAGSDTKILTTFAELGITDAKVEDMTHVEYLGRKVTVFRNMTGTSAAARASQTLPSAIVVGKRTDAVTATNTADFTIRTTPTATTIPEENVNEVRSLTLGDGAGGTYTFNQTGTPDLNLRFNLYAFTNRGILASDLGDKNFSRGWNGTDSVWNDKDEERANSVGSGGTRAGVTDDRLVLGVWGVDRTGSRLVLNEGSIQQELAKFVKAGSGNYELYIIDNGFDGRGNKEFFYTFIPYRAGVVRRSTSTHFGIEGFDGGMRIHGTTPTGGTPETGGVKVHDPHGFKPADVADSGTARDASREAYLYTVSGAIYNDLILKDKLDLVVTDRAVTAISGRNVTFAGTAAPITFNFARNRSHAIDALQGSDVTNRFRIAERWNVWADADGVELVANRTAGAPADTSKDVQYGVITDAIGTPVALLDGTIAHVYEVFFANTARASSALLSGDIGAGGANGQFIGMTPYGVNNAFNAYVITPPNATTDPDDTVKAALSRDGYDSRYGMFRMAGIGGVTITGNRLDLRVSPDTRALTNNTTAGTAINPIALINPAANGTKVLVYGTGAPAGSRAAIISTASFTANYIANRLRFDRK